MPTVKPQFEEQPRTREAGGTGFEVARAHCVPHDVMWGGEVSPCACCDLGAQGSLSLL